MIQIRLSNQHAAQRTRLAFASSLPSNPFAKMCASINDAKTIIASMHKLSASYNTCSIVSKYTHTAVCGYLLSVHRIKRVKPVVNHASCALSSLPVLSDAEADEQHD